MKVICESRQDYRVTETFILMPRRFSTDKECSFLIESDVKWQDIYIRNIHLYIRNKIRDFLCHNVRL